MGHWQNIINCINKSTGGSFIPTQQRSLGGGSINSAWQLSSADQNYFVKTNRNGLELMFAAEAKGLEALATSGTLRVPEVICFGEDDRQSFIVLEYLEICGSADQSRLGEQLAMMHRPDPELVAKQSAGQFGWEIENTIGATHQPNTPKTDWIQFWRVNRLGYQLELAASNGYGGELQSLGENLQSDFPVLFKNREIQASALHGDLWGGNVAGLADGTPVIFDPAFYYGDREADLAMTYLFGGFSANFYAAYQDTWPLDDGFETRKTFYNIYHIINHLNLFGGGYHGQAVNMIRQVLAEIR